ncbi:hypothetical protein JW766_00730 [Candidatus Dojkabacteria bacterium]|nr:hypothetical protein [Candidatus Dojkabacteria bacterium]
MQQVQGSSGGSKNTLLWILVIGAVLVVIGIFCAFLGGVAMYWMIVRVEDGEIVEHYDTSTTATTVPAQPPTDTKPKLGTIKGSVGYPSDFLPSMEVCAEDVNTGDYLDCAVIIGNGHEDFAGLDYTLKVPPGSYYVFAIITEEGDPNKMDVAYYTEFVKCGMYATCTSHQNVIVIVAENQVLTGINPVDWYE